MVYVAGWYFGCLGCFLSIKTVTTKQPSSSYCFYNFYGFGRHTRLSIVDACFANLAIYCCFGCCWLSWAAFVVEHLFGYQLLLIVFNSLSL